MPRQAVTGGWDRLVASQDRGPALTALPQSQLTAWPGRCSTSSRGGLHRWTCQPPGSATAPTSRRGSRHSGSPTGPFPPPVGPHTHSQPAAQGVPESLRGQGLIQRLAHEGLQVPEEGGRVHHQLPRGVRLRGHRAAGGGAGACQNLPPPRDASPALAWPRLLRRSGSKPKSVPFPLPALPSGRGQREGASRRLLGLGQLSSHPVHNSPAAPGSLPGSTRAQPCTSDRMGQGQAPSNHPPPQSEHGSNPKARLGPSQTGVPGSGESLEPGPSERPPAPRHPYYLRPQCCPQGPAGGPHTAARDGPAAGGGPGPAPCPQRPRSSRPTAAATGPSAGPARTPWRREGHTPPSLPSSIPEPTAIALRPTPAKPPDPRSSPRPQTSLLSDKRSLSAQSVAISPCKGLVESNRAP